MTLRLFIIAVLGWVLSGCGSSQSTDKNKAATPLPAISIAPPAFKFSMFISGSGTESKPQDAFTIDTNFMMGVKVTRRDSKGNFNTLNGLARLEPEDVDTLKTMIYRGDLVHLDQADLTEQCAPDELFVLNIVPADSTKPVQLRFNGCAKDYNLLLQPKRKYFTALMDWFERMRIKYRPNKPD